MGVDNGDGIQVSSGRGDDGIRVSSEGGDKCSVPETWTKLDIVKNFNLSENITNMDSKGYHITTN